MYSAMQDHWAKWGPPVYVAYAAVHKATSGKGRKRPDGSPIEPARSDVEVIDMRQPGAFAAFARDFGAAGGKPN